MNAVSIGSGARAILVSIFTLLTTVLWFVIGWRAMRAHERIAEVLDQRSRELRGDSGAAQG